MRLGIDTGGTYSDAVLYDADRGVVAAAKALTTKHDLALGIGEAMTQVLRARDGAGSDLETEPDLAAGQAGEPVRLVCISTTLATNTVVEGQGAPAGLLLIGYDEKALARSGLGSAIGNDPVAFIAGGHTPLGEPQAPLDREALKAAVEQHAGAVEAFAVAGYFAVRNPEHELEARELIRAMTGLPVTCAHELTSALDAPRRALTAILNARLIPQIQHLIEAVRGLMAQHGIDCPLMVVKGDGSLIRDSVALTCPVETILSGPAASVVGVRALSGEPDLLVSDIGGTTSDIAVLRDGRPQLSMTGATIGGWRTMVEAIAVHTYGLGGDSEVRPAEAKWPAGPGLEVGPRRVVPLSLLARDEPRVLARLEQQLARAEANDLDGRFVARLRKFDVAAASSMERRLWEQLDDGPVALEDILTSYAWQRPLGRLVDRGILIYGGFAPSDAAHLLGRQEGWSREAAALGAALLARRGLARGVLPELDADGLARLAVDRLVVLTGRAIVNTTLMEEDRPSLERAGGPAEALVDRAFERSGLKQGSLLAPAMRLTLPLAGVGAPAATYYPAVAERLDTRLVLPEQAAVCNAVGAVAGSVEQRVHVLVTSPEDGRYRVHDVEGLRDYQDLEAARTAAVEIARQRAELLARDAGAGAPQVEVSISEKVADTFEGDSLFVELEVLATAIGRPRLA